MEKAVSNSENSIFPVISLFSGAMGLDLGLIAAGLKIIVSQDYDKWCAETIRKNGHNVIEGDIRQLLDIDPECDFLIKSTKFKKDEIFAVVGGPPCQSFSTAGKRKGVEDERGMLYNEFISVITKIRPRFFIMENVKGLASMASNPNDKESMPLIHLILSKFKAIGYHTVYGVLDAVHYGTPQFRERLVIIGSRDHEKIFLPSPTHFHIHQNKNLRWKTLFDAIGDIADPGLYGKFTPTIESYLKLVPEGGNWRSLPSELAQKAMGGAYASGGGKAGFYRRLSYSEPSPTLVTSPNQKATLLCHPHETRPLSVNEYARIQGFPDTWKFEGKVSDCYRQIGNAVPIPLGKAIGEMLVSVALGNSEIKVKRMRGTSVHDTMKQMSLALSGQLLFKTEEASISN